MDPATITRYQQAGLIHASTYVKKRNDNKNFRKAYSPLAVIEFATAALLLRGDWMEPKSVVRLGHCTDSEVKYGRLVFYSKNGNLLPKGTKNKWKKTLQEYENTYSTEHPDMPASLIKARRQYFYELYKSTFWRMHDVLKESLKEEMK